MKLDTDRWQTLSAVAPTDLTDARLTLPWPLQIVSAFGVSLVEPAPDPHQTRTRPAPDAHGWRRCVDVSC